MYVAVEKAPEGFPKIVQAPTTKVVEVGHTAVLQCEVEGDPEPRVYWMKDFVPIDMADQRFTILPQGRNQRVLKKTLHSDFQINLAALKAKILIPFVGEN